MDATAEKLSGELTGLLEAADLERPAIDPRSLPWRFSTLKELARSPLHYWHSCQSEQDDRLCLRIGAGTHAILFDQPYKLFTERRAGKAWTEFSALHAGTPILNAREYAQAQAIADAVRRNKDATRYLFDGTTIEQRIDWTYLGRQFRSTPDAYRAGHFITELKSTRCAAPDRFVRDAGWRAYHVQLATYQMAVADKHDLGDLIVPGEHGESIVVAVESTAPHPVTVFRVAPETIERGMRTLRLWAEQALVCESTGDYPGYAQSIVDLDLGERDDPFSLLVNGEEIDL